MTKAKNPKSYVSSQDVYVEGQYFKAGQPFVTDDKPADHWEDITPKEAHAIEVSVNPVPNDPVYEDLDEAALKAIAVEKHVNPKGMKKDELITAIKAAVEPRL
ncbi:hypothetical protein [Sphingomonas sp.]|uniref:hypothetical protein n=1 Tax=Sphingomonas sp. TaxID=28214 RepID=UPI003B3A7455